jgi:hypothetical protein
MSKILRAVLNSAPGAGALAKYAKKEKEKQK